MRLVLDTNIIFSGFGWPNGSPGEIIHLWLEHKFKILVTTEIFTEYAEVLCYSMKALMFLCTWEWGFAIRRKSPLL